jgi:hypothetical protein
MVSPAISRPAVVPSLHDGCDDHWHITTSKALLEILPGLVGFEATVAMLWFLVLT